MDRFNWQHSSDLSFLSAVESHKSIRLTKQARRAALGTNMTVASHTRGPNHKMQLEAFALAIPFVIGCPSPFDGEPRPNAFEIYPVFGQGADRFEFLHSVVIPKQVEMLKAEFATDCIFMVIGDDPKMKAAILAHDWKQKEPMEELFWLRENMILPGSKRSRWYFAG